jgi:hypothetical protein
MELWNMLGYRAAVDMELSRRQAIVRLEMRYGSGYWMRMLGDMKAAGDNAGSASGLGALMAAMAPMQQAQPLAAKLSAELKRRRAARRGAATRRPAVAALTLLYSNRVRSSPHLGPAGW